MMNGCFTFHWWSMLHLDIVRWRTFKMSLQRSRVNVCWEKCDGYEWYWLPKKRKRPASKTRIYHQQVYILVNNEPERHCWRTVFCYKEEFSKRWSNTVWHVYIAIKVEIKSSPRSTVSIHRARSCRAAHQYWSFVSNEGWRGDRLLVVVDHLTKLTWATAIKNKKSQTVVDFLEHLFFDDLNSALDPTRSSK